MAGLLLKLAPNERILINGLMIENGPKKAKMTIHSDGAYVLRLRDALHPHEISGPISIAYHFAQLAVAGESNSENMSEELRPRIAELSKVFEGTWASEAITEAQAALDDKNFYKVMRTLNPLLPLEKDMLGATTQ